MIKREKQRALVLWGIVTYTLAILTYFTLKAFGHGADFISALGSIISATATFFAAYIAIVLFSDWKKQHNAQIKYNYIKDVLLVLRENLILLAPILNNVIVAGQIYINKDEVKTIDFKIETLKNVYANHKKSLLIFTEYNLIFKDAESYLLFLKFDTVIDKALSLMIKIDEQSLSDLEKLIELSAQLHMIAFPEVINGLEVTCYKTHEMTPLDLCQQIELHYNSLVGHLAAYRLME